MKRIFSLMSLGFVGSLACAQVTFLEKKDCPNHVSEAWGISSYGSDVSVRGDFALSVGYHPIGLYEYCEGNWKLLWSHVGNDAYDWIHPCGAIGEDYFAYTYQNNSLEYVRICEIADPSVSVIDIPIATGSATWGTVYLAFIGNDLIIDDVPFDATSEVYFASSGWATDQSIPFDIPNGANGNDVDNGRWVTEDSYFDFYSISYDAGEAEYIVDEVDYDFNTALEAGDEVGYHNSFVHQDRMCVSLLLWNTFSELYRAKVIFFEYDNGDWVYQNEVEESGAWVGKAFMGNRVILQDYFAGTFIVLSDPTSDWSSHTVDEILTTSNIVSVSAHGGHLLIGEVNGGDPVVYNSTTYYPGTVHFYENYELTSMELLINANGGVNPTSWEIRDEDNNLMDSGGGYTGSCSTYVETIDLPPGSYGLRIADADNTICAGGFLLRTSNGQVVIDATNNAAFSSPSEFTTTAANRRFQLPVGPISVGHDPMPTDHAEPIFATEHCVLDHLCGQSPWTVDDSETAYQWHFFEPHGTFTRHVAYHWDGSVLTNGQLGLTGVPFCTRARASRPSLIAGGATIPTGTFLNVRVRAKIDGELGPWGPISTVIYTNRMRPANWRVSPNPITSGNGQLRLEVVTQDEAGIPIIYDSELRMQSLRLLDLSGRVMASKGGLEYSIDAPFFWDISDVKLTTGMYLVEVTTNTGVSATKIMVQ